MGAKLTPYGTSSPPGAYRDGFLFLSQSGAATKCTPNLAHELGIGVLPRFFKGAAAGHIPHHTLRRCRRGQVEERDRSQCPRTDPPSGRSFDDGVVVGAIGDVIGLGVKIVKQFGRVFQGVDAADFPGCSRTEEEVHSVVCVAR